MIKVYFNLQFAVRRGPQAWVKSIRFADGPGMKVKSVTFTADRSQAAPLSRAHAHTVAEQFYHRVIMVHTTDGELHEEATREVAAAHQERRRANAVVRAEFNDFFRDAIKVVPGLAEALAGIR